MRLRSLAASLGLVIAGFFGSESPAHAQPAIVLDDFTSGVRAVNPNVVDPQYRNLWSQYPDVTLDGATTHGTVSTVPGKQAGTRALLDRITDGSDAVAYLQFYTNDGSTWHFMRELINAGQTWRLNTYNRLRFWVKVPPQLQRAPTGQSNSELDTYVRCSDCDRTSAESGGDHYYHFFNIPYTDQWHQIILDPHPNHQRGGSGSTEWGTQLYPTCSTATLPSGGILGGGSSSDCNTFNYMDALTRFYFQAGLGGPVQFPQDYYFERFELFAADPNENVDQVFSMNAVYVPGNNSVYVGWQAPKTETADYDVRYAFTDLYQSGWDAGTPAPGGTAIPAPNNGGYNGMEYETTAIDVTAHSMLYVAIKPQNSTRFREIAIPVGLTPSQTVSPAAPQNVRIVR